MFKFDFLYTMDLTLPIELIAIIAEFCKSDIRYAIVKSLMGNSRRMLLSHSLPNPKCMIFNEDLDMLKTFNITPQPSDCKIIIMLFDNVEMLKYIFIRGVQLPWLLWACESGSMNIINYFYHDGIILTEDYLYMSAVSSPETINFLLDKNAPVTANVVDCFVSYEDENADFIPILLSKVQLNIFEINSIYETAIDNFSSGVFEHLVNTLGISEQSIDYVVRSGDVEIIDHIYGCGITNGHLRIAVERNDYNMVEALLDDTLIDEETVLIAIRHGFVKIVELISNTISARMMEQSCCNSLEILIVLIDNGGILTSKCLVNAVNHKQTDIYTHLIAANCPCPSIIWNNAIYTKDTTLVQYLLESGAVPTEDILILVDNYGSAMINLILKYSKDIITLNLYKKVVGCYMQKRLSDIYSPPGLYEWAQENHSCLADYMRPKKKRKLTQGPA